MVVTDFERYINQRKMTQQFLLPHIESKNKQKKIAEFLVFDQAKRNDRPSHVIGA